MFRTKAALKLCGGKLLGVDCRVLGHIFGCGKLDRSADQDGAPLDFDTTQMTNVSVGSMDVLLSFLGELLEQGGTAGLPHKRLPQGGQPTVLIQLLPGEKSAPLDQIALGVAILVIKRN